MGKCIGVIPARYSSTRLPGKPLVDICGKTMIQRVYEQCIKSHLDEVVVATDDQRVFDNVLSFGGKVVMTSTEHTNGSSRIGEVVKNYDCDYVVNIQGDEPLISVACINKIVESLKNGNHDVVTLISKLEEEVSNPNVVKVVKDFNDNAIYFSRSSIPFNRDNTVNFNYFKHIGIYGYDKNFLLKYLEVPPTMLEIIESLEQLRVLEMGHKIFTIETNDNFVGIDTPEDLERVIQIISSVE